MGITPTLLNFRCGTSAIIPKILYILISLHKPNKQYLKLVEDPVMKGFRNQRDDEGETPLHKAIRERNIQLTEVLLTMDDINRGLKDTKGKTPMDLLDDACNKDVSKKLWNELCRRNGLVPGLMKFFLQKTNLYEVRNTLSVVAALLATITFTAGFTVPGGFNNDTGEALLAHKAAFIVFVISDAFAMCCSMLMLACLVWSMVCDNIKSLILIDHCMPILMMALGSTLVAFMTGVYTVLRQKCLWVAIIIIVMCSIVIFSAKKAIMNVLLCIFNPVKYKKYRDLEQGKEDTSQDGHSSVRGCGSPHQRNE